MAEADPLRRYVEAGIAFTQLTKARAEAMVRDLVKAGDIQREQTQDWVDELLDRSRKSTDSLVALIRSEIAQQLSSMGFATKKDLARLETRVDRLEAVTPATTVTARQAGKAAAKATRTAKAAETGAKAATTTARQPGATKAAGAAPPRGTASRTTAAKSPPRRPGHHD